MELTPRTRLEQRTRAAQLGVRDFVTRFAELAAETTRGALSDRRGKPVVPSERTVKRWLAGSATPYPSSRQILESWFGEPVEVLLGPPTANPPVQPVSPEEWIMSAGRESSEHALNAAAALDGSAIEGLHAQAQRAARNYYTTPPLTMHADLVALRDVVYEQLDRTHKPRQQAELYLIAGQVCGLLSSVSWDLGYPDVAEEQARAAHTYGGVIDHPSLQAWARALQVTVCFWAGNPRHAVAIAADALETAPRGTARARLHAVHARALAMIGARQEVAAELAAAGDELDYAGNDEFLDHIGGELGFNRSRRALCAGAAYVSLGDGAQAEIEATAALDMFAEQDPATRWGAGALGATADLGTARTLRGDLAGAEDALAPLFRLAPERRTEALSRRLVLLNKVLHTTQFRGAVEAGRIGEQIEDFTTHSLAQSTVRPSITSGQ